MPGTKHDRISERAYAIWESEGRPHGAQEQHWHQALSEIDAEDAGEAAAPAKKAPVKKATAKKPAAVKSPVAPKAAKAAAAPKAAGKPAKKA